MLLVGIQFPFLIFLTDDVGSVTVTAPIPHDANLVGVPVFTQFFDVVTSSYYKASSATTFRMADAN